MVQLGGFSPFILIYGFLKSKRTDETSSKINRKFNTKFGKRKIHQRNPKFITAQKIS